MFDIRKATAALIQATEDPTAPIKINQLHSAASSVGRMLAHKADKHTTQIYSESLTSAWAWDKDAKLEEVCYEPEFVIALCSMLCESLVGYTRKVSGDHSL